MSNTMRWLNGLAGALFVLSFAGLVSAQATKSAPPRTSRVPIEAKAAEEKPDDAPDEKPSAKPGDDADDAVPRRPPPPPPDPRYIRLHMLDGSVIAGKLSITELPVDTEYGKLSIPIAGIRSFVPGLESHPQLSAELAKLIDELGSEDFKTREQAHRDLAQRGRAIKHVLEERQDDSSAERRRHLQQLMKELDEQEVTGEEESGEHNQPWIDDDTIVTQRFTLVGRITLAEFQIESKYGPLVVKLADVVRGERDASGRESLRKSLTLPGNQLAQRGFKSTGLRVEAGDRVTIRAQGTVVMTPWGGGQMSTPDGSPQFAWYVPNEIPGGALVVRVGESGKVQKAGSRSTFVAKTSGTLQLAVAMAAEYSQEGYQYPGQYEVTVKVDPR